MQPKTLDKASEHRVRLDAVEDVEPAVERFLVVTAEMEVEGVEDQAHSDVVVEGRDEEPGAEVVSRDEGPACPSRCVTCGIVHG